MKLNQSLKHGARQIVDRLARPYVSQIESAVRSSEADVLSALTSPKSTEVLSDGWRPPSDTFHMAMHELRTLELERVPKGCRHVLSVGAQGGWYFDWFRRAYGDVDLHVGVEAFEARPNDLPDYAVWIENTADRMHDVAAGSIDLVFAGQTTEHLWAAELVGFLVESHRVLRANGLLVVDSPNRLVTEHLYWSHGGHSIEISAGEAAMLLELAGFEVVDVHGIWSCVIDGRVVELEDCLEDSAVLVRRAISGRDQPDQCFVWWINARRLDTEPQLEALTRAVGDLFERHWLTRVSRGFFPAPGVGRELDTGAAGRLAATLPFMLHAGSWRATIKLSQGSWADLAGPRLVLELPGEHTVFSWDLTADDVELDFELGSVHFALSFVLIADAVLRPVTIEFPIALRNV